MAAEPKYEMAVYPMVVAVRSASDGAAVHQVHLPWCDCADFTNRKGRMTAEGQYVSVCKHIAEAMARVGGWHRPAEPDVYPDLTLAALRALLRSSRVALSPSQAATVLRRVDGHGEGTFSASLTGAVADGVITYNRSTCHYTLTLSA